MPTRMLKVFVGRWKSSGGATCVCVREPGCAQAGGDVVDVPGICPKSKNGAAPIIRTGSECRGRDFIVRRSIQIFIVVDPPILKLWLEPLSALASCSFALKDFFPEASTRLCGRFVRWAAIRRS